MGQKDLIKLAVAVVLLLFGVGLIVARGGGQNRTSGQMADSYYYYDLQTGELFSGPTDAVGAIAAPSGGEGVRAFVYTCGECKQDELVIGYIQRLNDKAVEMTNKLAQTPEDQQMALYGAIQQGTFVAAKPEDGAEPQWVGAGQTAGMEIQQAFRNLCKGKLALICTPDKVK